MERTVKADAVVLKSIMSHSARTSVECAFCERQNHEAEKCFFIPTSTKKKPSGRMLDAIGVNKSKPRLNSLIPLTPRKRESSKSGNVELAGSIAVKTTIESPKGMQAYDDNRASVHCFYNAELSGPSSIRTWESRRVRLPDKSTIIASQICEVLISFKKVNVLLQNVLLLPDLGYNHVWSGRIADNEIESHFHRKDILM